MPTVSVNRTAFLAALEEPGMTDEQFDELCFDFGIELDDVVTEGEFEAESGAKGPATTSTELIYKIDVPANRYDILCLEGLVRALRVFMGKVAEYPRFIAKPAAQPQQIIVEKEIQALRPFVVGAVLRGVTFDDARYKSFIDLQDKLHQNICRKRTLVAIGTHDLDTIQGPFRYRGLAPEQIKFKALNQTEEFTAPQLMELYKKDNKLKAYLHIIEDKPVYPVIYDANDVVLSMPPIINGEHSKITLDTKNVLIECTATDLTKAGVVVDTVVAMFAEYCKEPFTYEPVEIVYPNGEKMVYPLMPYRKTEVTTEYINNCIGVELSEDEICKLLNKMALKSVTPAPGVIQSEIPPIRHDILHACDVMEDVAIAHGYNNIEKTVPKTNTIAIPLPINKLTDLLRLELAMCGYTEALTLSLCSLDEAFKWLRMENPGNVAVTIANPATMEFQMCRISLTPGLLKTIASNKKMPLPMKLFEISDVVLKDDSKDVGARNERRLCFGYYGQTSGLEVVHGTLDRLMEVLEVPYKPDSDEGYRIRESSENMFFPGRQAEVLFKGKKIGSFGILHPEALANYDLNRPCSILELNIEVFLK